MKHPPPKIKAARGVDAPNERLTMDEYYNALTLVGESPPDLIRPPFMLSQRTHDDNRPPIQFRDSVVSEIEINESHYIPADSPSQKRSTNLRLATIAALIVRTRQARDHADSTGNDDAWLKAMDRLWSLHESYAKARGGAAQ